MLRLQPVQRVETGCAPIADAPLILSGAASEWPAAAWTPESLAERRGDQPVALYAFTLRDAIPATLGEFVAHLNGEPTRLADHRDLYLAWDARLLGSLGLKSSYDFRSLFGGRWGKQHTAFWMGGAGAHTPLHTDLDAPNLHAVVHGRKRFVLFSPSETRFLYPTNIYEFGSRFSAVDTRTPNAGRHPLAARARGYVASLEPGDVLYIPPGWWHAVTCLETCVSLNTWLFTPQLLLSRNLYRDLLRALLHRLYGGGRCTCHGHGDLRRHLGWSQRVTSG